MKELLHFDPITLLVLIGGFIGTWTSLRKDSSWHTQWIQKHSEQCDEQRKQNNDIITSLKASTAQLVTLTDGHHERMNKIDDEVVRIRERAHDLANEVMRVMAIKGAR